MSTPPPHLPPLDGELVLGELLGRGAMGSVFEARERSMGRAFAVKVLHTASPQAAERFLREGQVVARLKHPGIVQLHRAGTLKGRLCLAYELVEGARSFEEAVRLEPDQAIPLLIAAGRALGAAHAAGLVHRDVKSDNLLVDRQGRLRVTDFGLVTGEDLERLTRSGSWVGTPQTMAPEQFGARQQLQPATDVWALGVLLYWSLCGRYPAEGVESLIELAAKITGGDFPRPSSVAQAVPAALEAVCLKALAHDPAERYPDGAAFAAALQLAAAAPEPGGLQGGARWGLTLTAVLGFVGLGVWLGRGALAPEEPSARASAEPSALASAAPSALASAAPSALASARPGASAQPGGVQPGATPEQSLPERLPSAEDLLASVAGWAPSPAARICPAELLERSYAGADETFLINLEAMKRGAPGTRERAGRALLEGIGVAADPSAAVGFLAHVAEEGDRSCYVQLSETLKAQGRDLEELRWAGRYAFAHGHLFELHRIWQRAQGEGELARLAQALWAKLPPSTFALAAVDLAEGGPPQTSHIDGAHFESPAERGALLIALAAQGWRPLPYREDDWLLESVLDRLSAPERGRLLRATPPERGADLLLLCARRGELELFEAAYALRGDLEDEALAGVGAELLKLRISPPSAGAIRARLERAGSPRARRVSAALCVNGWGGPAQGMAVVTLLGLANASAEPAAIEAGEFLFDLLGSSSGDKLEEALKGALQAGNPTALYLVGAQRLREGGPRALEGVRHVTRAAAGGSDEAAVLLSRLHRMEARSKAEFVLARQALEPAAERGYVPALLNLANFAEAGFGFETSEPQSERALRLLSRAAWLGDGPAALRVGALLSEPDPPEGWEKRSVSARRYLLRARAMGEAGADAALLQLDLRSGKAARARARAALAAAARANPQGAEAATYGRLLRDEGHLEEAVRWLAPSAASGLEGIRDYLALLERLGRGEEGVAYLNRLAAEQDVYGLIYAADLRFESDPEWSKRVFLALGRGRPQALVMLAQNLWEQGTPAGRREAWQLWRRAEGFGSRSARRFLARYEWPQ